ncbi:MAG TPA: flavin reductase [Treponema sp.]|nr:flavin reductase [Treponema sp.]
MNTFHTIKPEDFNESAFRLIGKEWMLITAENNGRLNTMTASWGGVGVLWNKNVAFIFVRKSRYTKGFIDNSAAFSLSILDHGKYAKTLSYLGTVSGRDEDKILKSGLTVAHAGSTPYFDEASAVLVCKKLYRQPIEAKNFIAPDIDAACYADKDYHDMYVGEITQLLVRDEAAL